MNPFSFYVKTLVLFLCICICALREAQSQCNPSLAVEPAYDCATAATSPFTSASNGFACDLEGLCISSYDAPMLPNTPLFCAANSVLNNPIWLAIKVDGDILDLDVFTYGCNGQGVQWALYGACGNLFNTIACQSNPVLPAGIPFNISAPVTPGNIYYLVLDGANSCACNFEFHVNQGTSPVSVGDPINMALTGKSTVCSGEAVPYHFAGFSYAQRYEWSFNGATYYTNDPEAIISVDTLSPGIYSLCVKGTNDCDEEGKTLCWDIQVADDTLTVEETLYTCPGDSVLFQGEMFSAGEYDSIPYSGTASCIAFVNLKVKEYQLPADTTLTVFLCADQDSLVYNGSTYEANVMYHDIPFENGQGCRFTGNLNVLKADISALSIHSSKDELPCSGQDTALLTLNGHLAPQESILSETYRWTGFWNTTLGTDRTLVVGSPGEYFLEITTYLKNPELIGVPGGTACVSRLKYIVQDSDVSFPPPQPGIIPPAPNSALYVINILNKEQYIGGTRFIWTVPEGIQYTNQGDGSIVLDLPEKGTYKICVYAKDICATSEETCFEIEVDETVSTSSRQIKGIRLIQNPVDNSLNFDITAGSRLFLKIFDMQGRMISAGKEVSTGQCSIDIHHLVPGVYIYQFTDKYGLKESGKFIKK